MCVENYKRKLPNYGFNNGLERAHGGAVSGKLYEEIMARQEIILCNEAGYREIYARYAAYFAPGRLVFLRGALGAGKTTFVRAVCDALQTDDLVSSPSFALLNIYHTLDFRIAHFDLFRLSAGEQLDTIGAMDFLDSNTLVFVEWPENCAGFFPSPDLEIMFEFAGDTEGATERRLCLLLPEVE
jgi:tRNA threonylcarbamoyladenosine biosynthesis protein TsaE